MSPVNEPKSTKDPEVVEPDVVSEKIDGIS